MLVKCFHSWYRMDKEVIVARPEKKERRPLRKPIVSVKSSSYQPSKAEMEEDVSVNATPRQLAEAALATVEVREEAETR